MMSRSGASTRSAGPYLLWQLRPHEYMLLQRFKSIMKLFGQSRSVGEIRVHKPPQTSGMKRVELWNACSPFGKVAGALISSASARLGTALPLLDVLIQVGELLLTPSGEECGVESGMWAVRRLDSEDRDDNDYSKNTLAGL